MIIAELSSEYDRKCRSGMMPQASNLREFTFSACVGAEHRHPGTVGLGQGPHSAGSGDPKLVAYCNLGMFGSFAMVDRVLGIRNGDGAMYLLMTDIAGELIAEGKLDYLMYDTFFGALPGLRDFKRRLGFLPYRARYSFT